ncbi:MAG: HAD-IIIC family phosphatase [Lachnospiraceae bacterium]|nr:HAD-IIIC family phosphatase [Lachnospiraceae bacterium]
MSKIAVLSNVNMDAIVKNLQRKYEVFSPAGYGNVVEELSNAGSELNAFKPDICFIIIDASAMFDRYDRFEEGAGVITSFFGILESAMGTNTTYYINDLDFRSDVLKTDIIDNIQELYAAEWTSAFFEFSKKHNNVHMLTFSSLVKRIGSCDFYSAKMWYLGRIPFSVLGRNEIQNEIEKCIKLHEGMCVKKVLLLDLDNTLWGGICGEGKVILSDENVGLIYKDLQYVIKRMKRSGVILGIVSKNNEEDALDVLRNNQHMILEESDFAIMKINWENKDKNIREIADELNVGLSSIVFFDDSENERMLVKTMLPEVTVPDFPDKTENLPECMVNIFFEYFDKENYTLEDSKKTELYRQNKERELFKQRSISYEDYLKELKIKIYPVSAKENEERVYQLVHKTNQFNLTTKRYSRDDLHEMLNSDEYIVYTFDIKDKFGDNGITAVVIVSLSDVAEIDTFIMSCRIMGRKIEDSIIAYVENKLKINGFGVVRASYINTEKNKPVEKLYDGLGYKCIECSNGLKRYELKLCDVQKRELYAEISERED